jgi:endonuclease/exonuclease/phosphatase family metal-dependent hydrolase
MMRTFVLSSIAVMVLACGGSDAVQPAPSAPSQVSAPAGGADTFTVMTFNIQHGLNNDGAYDLKWAVQTIAALKPDLVGVQELTRNHPSYRCEDQPARIADGLTAATGRRWSYIYHQEWTTTVLDCHGDGPETEGIGFFAPSPITEGASVQLWNGRLGVKTTMSLRRPVAAIVTHLASGKPPDADADRMRQLGTLLPWTAGQGSPRLFVCDCNANPDTPEYRQIRGMYHDAWADAVAAGTAKGRLDGITHKSSRIDYVFYEGTPALELVSVENVDTRALTGTEASDHRPLLATFRIR